MTAVPGPIRIGREVEFKVRKEDWSKYEILDGEAIIWIRSVIVKIREIEMPPGSPPEARYITSGTTLVATFFRNPQGSPTPEPLTPDDMRSGGVEVPSFTTLHEPWNEYLISGTPAQILTTKCVATRIRVFRDKFNRFGEPMVVVESQTVIGRPRDARPEELI